MGFSVTLFPFSWAVGAKRIRGKTLIAFGPLRFGYHRTNKSWKDY